MVVVVVVRGERGGTNGDEKAVAAGESLRCCQTFALAGESGRSSEGGAEGVNRDERNEESRIDGSIALLVSLMGKSKQDSISMKAELKKPDGVSEGVCEGSVIADISERPPWRSTNFTVSQKKRARTKPELNLESMAWAGGGVAAW